MSVHRKYNQQDATFSGSVSINCSTCFRRFVLPSSWAQNFTYSFRYYQTNTACCYRGWDGTLFHPIRRSRAGRPDHDQQHCYHHAPTVKPEAAIAVVELLMMDVRMPEACWAVFKRQVINLRNCCIWLVDSFESMMMHGLANPKS